MVSFLLSTDIFHVNVTLFQKTKRQAMKVGCSCWAHKTTIEERMTYWSPNKLPKVWRGVSNEQTLHSQARSVVFFFFSFFFFQQQCKREDYSSTLSHQSINSTLNFIPMMRQNAVPSKTHSKCALNLFRWREVLPWLVPLTLLHPSMLRNPWRGFIRQWWISH